MEQRDATTEAEGGGAVVSLCHNRSRLALLTVMLTESQPSRSAGGLRRVHVANLSRANWCVNFRIKDFHVLWFYLRSTCSIPKQTENQQH